MKAKQKIIASMALAGNGGLHREKPPAGAMKIGVIYDGAAETDANSAMVREQMRGYRNKGYHIYAQNVTDENGSVTADVAYFVDFAFDKRQLAA